MKTVFNMCFSTLRWKTCNLEPALAALKKSGWDSWEGRLPIDELGTPRRLKAICERVGLPLSVYTAAGAPEGPSSDSGELNRRRMDFAAEMEVDCFMFMTGGKPEGRPVSDDDVKVAAEHADEWADYASQYNLEISFHIHTNNLVDSIEHWRLYMSRLTKAKLCIDVSHSLLWGLDPAEAIKEFRSQLNYIHLQDYSSTSRDTDGNYLPVWCDVGHAVSVDFPAVFEALEEIGFKRVVTACPGEPPLDDDAMSEAARSATVRKYLAGIGY